MGVTTSTTNAGSTKVPIATTTVSGANSYTFSSIPQTYTSLILVSNNINTGTNSIVLQFNGDTSTSYSDTMLQGDGTSASSQRDSNNDVVYIGGTSSDVNLSICHIMNYSNTNTYKTILSRANWGGYNLLRAIVGLWRNTSAITSIKVYTANGANFSTGSTFTLYGIKAA